MPKKLSREKCVSIIRLALGPKGEEISSLKGTSFNEILVTPEKIKTFRHKLVFHVRKNGYSIKLSNIPAKADFTFDTITKALMELPGHPDIDVE